MFDDGDLEICTMAGYEARRIKTGSPPWDQRDKDTRRRYREIVQAAFAELPRLGYAIVPVGDDEDE